MTEESQVPAVVETVVDQPMDFTVVARDPTEMVRAQRSLVLWAARKIVSEIKDLKEAQEQLEICIKNKWKTDAWRKRVKMSERKVTFYKKIKGALEAGYYIVPPFPLDIFAVRTDRDAPKRKSSHYNNFPEEPKLLEQGEGRYVNILPSHYVHTVYQKKADGTPDYERVDHNKTWYSPANYQDVDFPFKLAKVEVMAETSKAFALKLFDQFGILPRQGLALGNDPIICGQILSPHKNKAPVTFFVAWWLDTRTL